ncbi:MAG: hypothetical protein JXR56_05390, partial [Candidatus Cloacimonetes bacterium]|nr:hypothetical protein [Candidatus Cloacimonadota bacterium]
QYNGVVTVAISAADLNNPVNTMPTEEYSFTCIPDLDAPYISASNPADENLNVPRETDITFSLADDLTGVDITSLQLFVNDIDVSNEAVSTFVTNHYEVLYSPIEVFEIDSWVYVHIICTDLAITPNQLDTTYRFKIIPDLVPPYLFNLSPEANSIGATPSERISFEVHDEGLGVDISTLAVYINANLITPETEQLSGSFNYRIWWDHPDFDYGETINVVVSVSDLCEIPNVLSNYTYSYTIADDDLVAPFFCSFTPAPQSSDNPVDTSIFLDILDAETGINPNSILFNVNNSQITTFELEEITTQDATGYRLKYIPEENFNYHQTVNVQVYAMDNSSNHNSASMNYNFTTINDLEAPYLVSANPYDGEAGYAYSIIFLKFRDDLSGINPQSFDLSINEMHVNTFTTDELFDGFEVRYVTGNLSGGTEISISYSISDNVGNVLNDHYSFQIIEDNFEPYFAQINPLPGIEIPLHGYLQLAVLDKGTGIEPQSIHLKINNRSIMTFNLDSIPYSSNPDSLGFLLSHNLDENYYPGQQLLIEVSASDKTNPDYLSATANFNVTVARELNKEKIIIVPNIITPNYDGYNDKARIIIPSEREADEIECTIFEYNGKKVTSLSIDSFIYTEPGTNINKQYKSALWNGRNDRNYIVQAGLYICQVKINGRVYLNSIALAK